VRQRLQAMLVEREHALSATLAAEKDGIARACHAMARAFAAGGTLHALGTGAAASDAAHVAVEFMHPVIVGKRALPALAPTNDVTGATSGPALLRSGDIALGLVHAAEDPAVTRFLEEAHRRGALTLALTGAGGAPRADHVFVVPSGDPQVVQEVQETVYHVLWELVHVFFEHAGLLEEDCSEGACLTCGDVAVAARVVDVADGTALVEAEGRREEVATDLLGAVAVGDVVLCHAGVALQRADAGEAG